MAVDPMIARGSNPGEGILGAIALAERIKLNREDSELAKLDMSMRQQRISQDQQQFQQEQSKEQQDAKEKQEASLLLPFARQGNPQAIKALVDRAAAVNPMVADLYKADPEGTGKRIVEALEQQMGLQPKQSPMPSSVQEYEYAQANPGFQQYQDRNRQPAGGGDGGGKINWQRSTKTLPDGRVQDIAFNPRTLEERELGAPRKPTTAMTGNPTEAERKVAALGVRLEGSLRSLSDLETDAPGSSTPTLLEAGASKLGEYPANLARSSERQQADVAQLDALDAALTLATGAAYTKEQLFNLRKSYFPQLGDSAATVKAKEQRFKNIVQAARVAAGRAAPMINQSLGDALSSRAHPQPRRA